MQWDGPVRACGGGLAVAVLFRRLVPADSDTPWHLAEGRLLLRRWVGGAWEIGRTDSFSWTARGLPWHPNSWGFDALMAATYHLGGWLGVAVLRVVLLAAIVALAWAYSHRSGVGRWARAGAVWMGAVLVIPNGAMRPQLASFVLLLAGLELSARILRADAPLVPLLFALAAMVSIGSTLHGGVIVGVAAMGAACAGHAFDTGSWRRPALFSGVAIGSSCLSPLGITVWTYALRTGGDSRREGIEEWQPPQIHRADQVGVLVFLVLLVAAALWLRSDGRVVGWALILPAVLTTALAFLAVRNSTFAVLSSVPLLAAVLAGAGRGLDRRGWAPPIRSGVAMAGMTIGALIAGAIQTGGFSLDPNPMGAQKYPSLAARALPSGCRLLNEYHFGGYLIQLRPDIPVSQDGRNDLYGSSRLTEQENLFYEGEPAKATSELDRFGVNCVLAEPSRPLVRALAGDPRWRLVAADAVAQAWVRSP